jgi:predicted RND superfamily exporter protein
MKANNRFIEATPVLDFNSLEPGKKATDAIRSAAAGLDLASRYQARVRLTGPVPIENEEFATVREGAATNGVITLAVVLLILWMALRSFRIIVAVVIALFIGLSITAALGLMMVGALNLISVPSRWLARQDYYPCSDLYAAIEVGHIFIGKPNAAR